MPRREDADRAVGAERGDRTRPRRPERTAWYRAHAERHAQTVFFGREPEHHVRARGPRLATERGRNDQPDLGLESWEHTQRAIVCFLGKDRAVGADLVEERRDLGQQWRDQHLVAFEGHHELAPVMLPDLRVPDPSHQAVSAPKRLERHGRGDLANRDALLGATQRDARVTGQLAERGGVEGGELGGRCLRVLGLRQELEGRRVAIGRALVVHQLARRSDGARRPLPRLAPLLQDALDLHVGDRLVASGRHPVGDTIGRNLGRGRARREGLHSVEQPRPARTREEQEERRSQRAVRIVDGVEGPLDHHPLLGGVLLRIDAEGQIFEASEVDDDRLRSVGGREASARCGRRLEDQERRRRKDGSLALVAQLAHRLAQPVAQLSEHRLIGARTPGRLPAGEQRLATHRPHQVTVRHVARGLLGGLVSDAGAPGELADGSAQRFGEVPGVLAVDEPGSAGGGRVEDAQDVVLVGPLLQVAPHRGRLRQGRHRGVEGGNIPAPHLIVRVRDPSIELREHRLAHRRHQRAVEEPIRLFVRDEAPERGHADMVRQVGDELRDLLVPHGRDDLPDGSGLERSGADLGTEIGEVFHERVFLVPSRENARVPLQLHAQGAYATRKPVKVWRVWGTYQLRNVGVAIVGSVANEPPRMTKCAPSK